MITNDNWQETFNYIDISVAILALIHNGKISASCQSCSTEFKKDTKCMIYHKIDEFEYDEPVFYSPELNIECYQCPISLIPSFIFILYDTMKFNDQYKPNNSMSNTSSLIWWFTKTYQHYCNVIQSYDIEQQNKKMKKGNRR